MDANIENKEIKEILFFLSKNHKKSRIHITEFTKELNLPKKQIISIILEIIEGTPNLAEFDVSSGWFIWLEEKNQQLKHRILAWGFLIVSIVLFILNLIGISDVSLKLLAISTFFIMLALSIYLFIEGYRVKYTPEKLSREEKLQKSAIAASIGLPNFRR